ncbi:MAG: 3-oxoacyl-[acyl-carrier-protein] synthase III C-terminal domain-containing protein [Thermoanaerobaculia bacterium]|nr:3-oxoacyl-[acyl-carrier-protein] synthase III C-terminal domain-containing protein [Thermoanaerobaculia bacterium]
MSALPRAILAGTGVAVPPLVVDNHALARVMDTSDEWIRERSGIVTRHFVEAGVGSADLGAEATKSALDDAGMEPDELDYVVCATMTPDHYFPGSGTLIQERLEIDPLPALDIRQQCAGFAYGLQVVDALIRGGIARNVVLVGTDVHTALMPFSDRSWRVLLGEEEGPLPEEELEHNNRFRHLVVLFGDAAGAMVFRAGSGDDGRGILGHRLYGEGGEKEILFVPGVGSRRRPYVSQEILEEAAMVPVMDGRAVFKHAVSRMPEVTVEVLEERGLGVEDLDLVVMHQANLRINEAARRRLGLPEERVHNNIQEYGNTTSATLPLCFHEAREAGKAAEGSLVAFAALGAGLHWGAVLMRV